MQQPEQETVQIISNIFNVFNHNERKLTDYDWKSSNPDVVTVTDSFYGSLSSKIGIQGKKADSIDIYIPKESDFIVTYVDEQKKSTSLFDNTYLDKKDKYNVFTGGNHPLINIKTLGDPNNKLLIIKDSYANCFLPFLTSHYGEINVVDLRYFYDDLNTLIENKEITDILFLYNANTFNSDDSILNIGM